MDHLHRCHTGTHDMYQYSPLYGCQSAETKSPSPGGSPDSWGREIKLSQRDLLVRRRPERRDGDRTLRREARNALAEVSIAAEPEVYEAERIVRLGDSQGGGPVGGLRLGICKDVIGLGMGCDATDDGVRGASEEKGVVGDGFIGADTGVFHTGDRRGGEVVELDFS